MERGGEDPLLGGFRVSRVAPIGSRTNLRGGWRLAYDLINQPVNSSEVVAVGRAVFRHVCTRRRARLPIGRTERRWVTLGVICLALVVITIDNTILNVALPTHRPRARRQRVAAAVDRRLLRRSCSHACSSTAGALGDKYGRKGALMCGVALFGMLLQRCASFATSPDLLIVCRGLMGIGGALIYPTTLSILTNTFTGRERARAIGIWAGISGIGIAIGPLGRRVPRRALLVGRGVPRERADLHRSCSSLGRGLRADVA